jgi:hypothetical protein
MEAGHVSLEGLLALGYRPPMSVFNRYPIECECVLSNDWAFEVATRDLKNRRRTIRKLDMRLKLDLQKLSKTHRSLRVTGS